MTKKILLGTLFGGMVLFLWSAASWEALHWHTSSFRNFSNEDAMTQTLVAGAKEPGMYSIPGRFEDPPALEKLMRGPFMFASVRPGPMNSGAGMILGQALIQFGAAPIVTLLLMQARGLKFGGRVLFVAGIGLAGGIAAYLPEMIWWGFAASYTAVNMADMVIGFTLAGIVLAKIAEAA